jgi:hypothetical protein
MAFVAGGVGRALWMGEDPRFPGCKCAEKGVADWAHGANKGLTDAGDSDTTLACGILVNLITASGLSVTEV